MAMTTKRLNPTPQLFLVLQLLAKEGRMIDLQPACKPTVQDLFLRKVYGPAQQAQAYSHVPKTVLISNHSWQKPSQWLHH